MKNFRLAVLLFSLLGMGVYTPLYAQVRPGTFSTLNVTATSGSAKIGCAPGASTPTCVGELVTGSVLFPDSNTTHTAKLFQSGNITADRTLGFDLGDANRTITFSGSPTLGDWFDQSVKTTASPTLAGLTTSGSVTRQAMLSLNGTVTGPGGVNNYGISTVTTLNPAANDIASGMVISPIINEASSGNHSQLSSLFILPPSITSGAATATIGASLYVNAAPSGTFSSGAFAQYVASGDSMFVAGVRERSRSYDMGETQNVAHSGSNFTGSGTITWTVEAADQVTYSYRVVGDTAWFNIQISNSSISGTGNQLVITSPFTFAERADTICIIFDNSGSTITSGWAFVTSGSNSINILMSGTPNFAASANQTSLKIQFAAKIQ